MSKEEGVINFEQNGIATVVRNVDLSKTPLEQFEPVARVLNRFTYFFKTWKKTLESVSEIEVPQEEIQFSVTTISKLFLKKIEDPAFLNLSILEQRAEIAQLFIDVIKHLDDYFPKELIQSEMVASKLGKIEIEDFTGSKLEAIVPELMEILQLIWIEAEEYYDIPSNGSIGRFASIFGECAERLKTTDESINKKHIFVKFLVSFARNGFKTSKAVDALSSDEIRHILENSGLAILEREKIRKYVHEIPKIIWPIILSLPESGKDLGVMVNTIQALLDEESDAEIKEEPNGDYTINGNPIPSIKRWYFSKISNGLNSLLEKKQKVSKYPPESHYYDLFNATYPSLLEQRLCDPEKEPYREAILKEFSSLVILLLQTVVEYQNGPEFHQESNGKNELFLRLGIKLESKKRAITSGGSELSVLIKAVLEFSLDITIISVIDEKIKVGFIRDHVSDIYKNHPEKVFGAMSPEIILAMVYALKRLYPENKDSALEVVNKILSGEEVKRHGEVVSQDIVAEIAKLLNNPELLRRIFDIDTPGPGLIKTGESILNSAKYKGYLGTFNIRQLLIARGLIPNDLEEDMESKIFQALSLIPSDPKPLLDKVNIARQLWGVGRQNAV